MPCLRLFVFAMQSAPAVTHDRSIRKRARAAEQKAEQQPEGKTKKPRTAKKPSQAQLEHAVAQPVPEHITGQAPQEQPAPVLSLAGQGQLGSLAAPTDSAALLGIVAGDVSGSPSQLQPGSALSQGQTNQQSSLLQLAQQQMQ